MVVTGGRERERESESQRGGIEEREWDMREDGMVIALGRVRARERQLGGRISKVEFRF